MAHYKRRIPRTRGARSFGTGWTARGKTRRKRQMQHISEEELADGEARLKEGQWLPRLVSLGLIAPVREVTLDLDMAGESRAYWCVECGKARQEREALQAQGAEREEALRRPDEALAGPDAPPLPRIAPGPWRAVLARLWAARRLPA